MNNTGRNGTVVPLFTGVPWMIVYICEAFLILAGNSVTINVFWKIRKTLKRTSYLLINLAVADLLVGVGLGLHIWEGIAIELGKVVSPDVGRSAMSIDILGSKASVFSLALISLERMFAILWPFRHRVLETRYYFVSANVVWLLAALATAMNGSIILERILPDGSGVLLATSVIVICSLLVVTTAYSAIWIATKRNRMPSTASRSMDQNRKLARTLFIVTVLSIITWLPLSIGTIFSYHRLANVYSFEVQIPFALTYSNSFLNPMVYCFRMVEFKQCLKGLFCQYPRRKQSKNHIPTEQVKGISLTSFRTVNSVYPLQLSSYSV